MKKIFLLLALVPNLLLSQVYIKKVIDEIDKHEWYVASDELLLNDPYSNRSIEIYPIFTSWASIRLFSVKVKGYEVCNQSDKLVIALENGDVINLINRKDFNCLGEMWCNISSRNLEKLTKSNIKAIRVINGRGGQVITLNPLEENKTYFVELINAVITKDIR